MEVIHDDKYLINKIKSYGDEIKTDFHNDRLPKRKPQCLTYSIIIISSVYRNNKLYYPQTLLVQCEYIIKDKLIKWFVIEDLTDLTDSESVVESDKVN